jgi:hypothetical protein
VGVEGLPTHGADRPGFVEGFGGWAVLPLDRTNLMVGRGPAMGMSYKPVSIQAAELAIADDVLRGRAFRCAWTLN